LGGSSGGYGGISYGGGLRSYGINSYNGVKMSPSFNPNAYRPKVPNSSQPKSCPLSKEQLKAQRSLEKRISEHEQKLQQFKANPTVRPGMEGLSKDLIKKQQERRMDHLQKEIDTFRKNIEKINRGEL